MPRPLDLAADGGVFENEPAVRTDVVRSDEFEPDVIPVAQMRSTRVMWARKEREQDQPTNYKQPAREVKYIMAVNLLYDSSVLNTVSGQRRQTYTPVYVNALTPGQG